MKYLPYIIFFGLASGILLLGSLFVVYSWSKFLEFNETRQRFFLLLIILLSEGFIVASLWARFSNSIWPKLLYQLTATWVGFFSNFFIATILVWLFYPVIQKYSVFNSNFFIVLAVIVVLVSIFGLINAKKIYYRQEVVLIENLPPWWRGKKIVQLSDVHLNNIHNEKFLEPLIENINKQEVAAIFLTGDFFDGIDGRANELALPLRNLHTEKGIYFISGNHEMYMGLDLAIKALRLAGVNILDDQKITIEGLNIVGARFPARDGLRRNLLKLITDLDLQRPSIFLYHDPRQVKEIAASKRVDLMLSGHTHNGQLWPYNLLVRWIYGVYGIGRHQLGIMTQFTSAGVGTWGPPMRLTARPEVVFFTLK